MVLEHFRNLNPCTFFFFKPESNVFDLSAVLLGNFQYGEVHKVQFFMIANSSTLKEYEIITLMYNRKASRLKTLI